MKTILLLIVGLALVAKAFPRDPAREIYDKALPSIVFIETDVKVQTFDIFGLLPPFKPKVSEEKITHFSGTGFVINHKLITALHVLADAEEIRIMDSKGRVQKAHIVKIDTEQDLAELEVDHMLPSLHLGPPPSQNDKIIQIGNPGDLLFVMTEGRYYRDGFVLIETHPGNSGSPLLNSNGRVVGLCHYIRNGTNITFVGKPVDLYKFLQ